MDWPDTYICILYTYMYCCFNRQQPTGTNSRLTSPDHHASIPRHVSLSASNFIFGVLLVYSKELSLFMGHDFIRVASLVGFAVASPVNTLF